MSGRTLGRISVVVTTYNRPDALAAVLAGLAAQVDRNFDVIIADDGSTDDTARLIAARDVGVPLRHVWQPDRGFRVARARNRAIAASSGDYLVFLDGDCVPRPDFVTRHRALAEPGWFVAGNRVLLSRVETEHVLARGENVGGRHLANWGVQRALGRVNRLLPLVGLPDGAWRRADPARWQGARTCNMAVWKRDLDTIDGFDAAFEGWGLEDTDLALRLMRAGIRRKDGRFATGVIHLWHQESDRSHLVENQRRLDEMIAATRVRAERGLSTLTESDD
jgi:glycosyltransferase involved in cell wall biosynthesis